MPKCKICRKIIKILVISIVKNLETLKSYGCTLSVVTMEGYNQLNFNLNCKSQLQ